MKSKNKIYLSLLSCIVLILIIIAIRFDPPSSETKRNQFWSNKAYNEEQFDLVVFGDSRVYRGVNPNLLAQHLELSSYNFGYSGAGFNEASFEYLDEQISRTNGGSVLLGVSPYEFTPKGNKNDHLKQELNRKPTDIVMRRYISPNLTMFDPITFENILCYGFNKCLKIQYQEKFENNGWVATNVFPVDSNAALSVYKKDYIGNQVDHSSINLLLKQVRNWSEEGVKVFAFRPPTTFALLHLENNESGFNSQQFIDHFTQNGGTWIDLNYKNYQSYDGSHINEYYAQILSKKLAIEIEKALK